MSRIAPVTDSSAYLPPELAEKPDVHVIPLYVQFDGRTYRDGVDIDTATFYKRSKPRNR